MKYDFQENRQIRIFISSTFRDMMKERDYLITKVFPELRRYCEERDISLFELDLRWGVTQEESENQMAFKICLNEVGNTRPFFIGLLGERYGWVPDEKTIERMKPTNVFEEYEWLMDELKKKKSITEVEMQDGAFLPQDEINAYFYIRSHKMETPDEFREEKGSHGEKMLLELKDRIKNDSRYDENIYDSAEHLGKLVEEDFKALVDKLFPGQGHLSAFEKERLQQHVYLKSKTRSYVAHPEWFNFLDDFADGEESKTAVTGERGMGKSALLANWIAERLKKQIENEKIIYHFTGVSQSGGDYYNIVRRLIDEVRSVYNFPQINEDIRDINEVSSDKTGEADEDGIEIELQNLLFAVPEEDKLLIVLGSLDRLDNDDNAKMLNWLPKHPAHVKMIFSSSKNDKSMEALTRISDRVLEVTALPSQMRRELTAKYFEKFSKKFSKEQMDRIVSDKKCESPATLVALLDNLRIFGSFDIFDKQIDERLSRENNESLYDIFLQDIESLFNEWSTAKDILSFIALSRRGLTETEIVNISKTAKLYWSQLSNCMSAHLISINGFVTFSSGIMLNAVKKRYLKDSAAEEPYRQLICAYMETDKEVSLSRKNEELTFQLLELKAYGKLYNLLLDYETFDHLYYKNKYELGSFWHTLHQEDPKRYTMEKYLEIVIEDPDELLSFYERISSFINDTVFDYSLALRFAEKYLEIGIKRHGDGHEQTANAYIKVGQCYSRMFKYEKSLEYYDKALAIQQKIFAKDHLQTGITYNNIAYCYTSLGKNAEALEYYAAALEIIEKMYGEESPVTAAAYNNIGFCYINAGDFQKADRYITKAMKMREDVYGIEHPITASSYENMGVLKFNLKEYEEAIDNMLYYVSAWKAIFGEDFHKVALAYSNIAMSYMALGSIQKTFPFLNKAFEIFKKIGMEECKEAGSAYFTLGMLYYKSSMFDKAVGPLVKFLAINVKFFGEEDKKSVIVKYNIGHCYFDTGDFEKSVVYFEEALPGYKEIYGATHVNVAQTLTFIGMCHDQMGETDKAVARYREALEIHEALGGFEEKSGDIREAIERLTGRGA